MSQVDPEIKALQDSIFLSKVARARKEPMDVKIFDGPRLFDQSCILIRSGIRAEHPNFTEQQVEQELRRYLKIQRVMQERGLYVDAGFIDEQL